MKAALTRKWDVADHLKSDAAIKAYIEAAFDDDEPALILLALRDVARVRGGLSKLSQATGLSLKALQASLSKAGNPRASTLFKIMKALNMKVTTKAALTRGTEAAERLGRRTTK